MNEKSSWIEPRDFERAGDRRRNGVREREQRTQARKGGKKDHREEKKSRVVHFSGVKSINTGTQKGF